MKKTYRIKNLCCANCAAKIETALNRLPGVEQATVDFMTERLILRAETADWDGLMDAVLRVFAKIEPECEVVVR